MSKKIIIATTAGAFTLSAIGLGLYVVSEPAQARDRNFQTLESRNENIKAIKAEINTALDEKNYEAWKTAIKKLPNEGKELLEKIDTQEKFNKLVEMHELKDKANQIAEDLEIRPRDMHKGFKKLKNLDKGLE